MRFAPIKAAAFVSIFLVGLVAACVHKSENALFESMKESGIVFENKVEDGKVENSFLFRNFYNGGGVGIGDINNDGLPDVFLTSNMGSNKLFLNRGNWKFDDISHRAGITGDDKWSTGVTFADVNNDGWLDIYVCSSGHMGTSNRLNKLYINNHDLTFTESAASYGLDISAYCTQVSFFDYDLDGDLDCFVIENSPVPINQLDYANMRDLIDSAWKVGQFLKGGGDHLYRNDNGHYHEVTQSAGIHGGLISFGLGVSVTDINGDGYPDVFVSNDSYERDYLYINQRNGTFKDQLTDYFQHTSLSSMGADIADINNDGLPDVFTTDMLPDDDYRLKLTGSFDNIDLYNGKVKAGFYQQFVKNCLQVNRGNGHFTETGNYSGVSASDWSWGGLMIDMDNDGLNDIFVCNGVNRDVTNLDFLDFFANDIFQRMVLEHKKKDMDEILSKIPRTPLPNKAFHNLGSLRFSDEAKEWGLGDPTFSNGAAYGDLDNDGDLDLIVNNVNEPAGIFRNRARELNGNHFLSIRLKGKGKNGFAIGAKMECHFRDSVLTREMIPSRGFQSSVDYTTVIGLGKATSIDSLVVVWPDRLRSVILHPAIDRVRTITEDSVSGEPLALAAPATETPATIFQPGAQPFARQVEDNFIDFYREYNIPQMLSREGPRAATADVNGDGRADVFIGGTAGHPGVLYLQTVAGGFTPSPQTALDAFPDFEDGAVLFFDADHDGDSDLVIGPGGNNMAPNSRQAQLRLFLNDGKGQFTLQPSAFPNTGMNVSAIAAADVDGDGDQDLFVGGLSVPGFYGATPPSFLLINDGKGIFRDLTATIAPELARAGMITNASFADFDADGRADLLLSGLWMAPRIFLNKKDGFHSWKTSLDGLNGWWESGIVTDLDGDGKPDIVLGNVGENFYLQPDSLHPVKLWIDDFDNNGIMDKIVTRRVGDKDVPVFLKHDLEKQVPGLKKQNLKHGDFARRSVQELFPSAIDKSTMHYIVEARSLVAMNEGGGRFKTVALPTAAQLSSVRVIHPMDINGDGKPDLVIAGNDFGFLPEFGRLDGNFGEVLINQGKGAFSAIPQFKTGLYLPGQTRDLAAFRTGTTDNLLFLVNDSTPSLYRFRGPGHFKAGVHD